MQIETPVTLKQADNVVRKKMIYSFIIVFSFLFILAKQDVCAAEIEENVNTLEAQSIEYTEEELILLATVIYAEAGGCDELEQFCVGNVILNRLNDTEHSEFKDVNTITEVIYQKNQFTSIGGKAWNRGPTETQKNIARELLEGKRVLDSKVVWFSKKMIFGKEYYTSDWHVFSGWM